MWSRTHFALLVVTVLAAASGYAQDWPDFATVSMTNPTTPKRTANRICHTDGRDLLCDGAAGLLTTSGILQITNVSATGNVSAVKFIGDGSGPTSVSSANADRIVSGRTFVIAVSDTSFVSVTQHAGTPAGSIRRRV